MDWIRTRRKKEGELQLRCMVARYKNPTSEQVIGISMGSNSKGESCFDICTLEIRTMNEEFITKVKMIKEDFEYFTNPRITDSKSVRKKN